MPGDEGERVLLAAPCLADVLGWLGGGVVWTLDAR